MGSTIKDIAKICGISEGTVDRALNNRKGISEETKNRILEVARDLDYKPNHIARSLATGSTYTIGIVCVDLKNNFYSMLIEAIESIAKENGYFINLILTHNNPSRELEGIKYLSGRQIDGLIIFPVGKGEGYVNVLKGLNIPIVTIYNRLSKDFVHVDVDSRQIMKNAVSYIVHKGYSKVIYLDPRLQKLNDMGVNMYSIDERRKGYIDGVKKEGLKDSIIIETPDENEIISMIKQDKKNKIAVLCPFDKMAVEALNMFKRNGVKVPEDVGIMGFDNIEILKYITPKINSVDCSIERLGEKAFSALYRMIKFGEKVEDYIESYSFTEGETL